MALGRTVQTGLLASGRLAAAAVGIATSVVLVRVFDAAGFGTFRQTLLAFEFTAPLLALGLSQALFFFLPAERLRPGAVLLENLLPLAVMGAAFGGFLLLGGADLLASCFSNPALRETLPILLPYALVALPAAAVPACLLARDRPAQAALYGALRALCIGGSAIGAAALWGTVEAALAATVAAAAVMLLPGLGLMLSACRGGSWHPTLAGAGRQLGYSLPLAVAGIVDVLNVQLDKVIVSGLTDPATFAVYDRGASDVPLIGILTGSAASVLLPQMTRLYREGRLAESLAMWRRAAAKVGALLIPAAAWLFLLAPELMALLYTDRYVESAGPFRVYVCLLPVRVVSYAAVFMAAGRPGLILPRACVALATNAVASVAAVLAIGPIGAALASVAVIYVWSVPYNLFWARRLMRAPLRELLPWMPLGAIAGVALALALALGATRAALGLDALPFALLASVALGGLAAIGLERLGSLDLHAVLGSPRA